MRSSLITAVPVCSQKLLQSHNDLPPAASAPAHTHSFHTILDESMDDSETTNSHDASHNTKKFFFGEYGSQHHKQHILQNLDMITQSMQITQDNTPQLITIDLGDGHKIRATIISRQDVIYFKIQADNPEIEERWFKQLPMLAKSLKMIGVSIGSMDVHRDWEEQQVDTGESDEF